MVLDLVDGAGGGKGGVVGGGGGWELQHIPPRPLKRYSLSIV